MTGYLCKLPKVDKHSKNPHTLKFSMKSLPFSCWYMLWTYILLKICLERQNEVARTAENVAPNAKSCAKVVEHYRLIGTGLPTKYVYTTCLHHWLWSPWYHESIYIRAWIALIRMHEYYVKRDARDFGRCIRSHVSTNRFSLHHSTDFYLL